MEKKTNKYIAPIIISLGAFLILDYVNLPSYFGFATSNVNMDLFGVFFETSIVLVLYVISFYYIDNKQNEKDANARDMVCVLLRNTYQECLDNLLFLDDRVMIEKFIIPKIDGKKHDSENKIINNLQTLPFTYLDTIIDLATSGYIEKSKLSDYLEVKKEYQYLVSIKITFFDLTDPQTEDQMAMYNDINDRDFVLKEKLGKLLNEFPIFDNQK